MSTRTQLQFVAEYETADGETDNLIAQVYKHSDGYPEGVLPDLIALRDLLTDTGTFRGPDYAAANFVFLGKLRGMGLYLPGRRGGDPTRELPEGSLEETLDPANWHDLSQPMFLLGAGVENPANGIHGDEAYLYRVHVPSGFVGDDTGPNEWTVDVSTSFPSHGSPREEAFERAEWTQYGSLEEALAAFD